MWDDVLKRIGVLARLDRNYVVYGANHHKYRFNAIPNKSEVIKVEEGLGVRLPDELRNFYLYLGNGGVGPD